MTHDKYHTIKNLTVNRMIAKSTRILLVEDNRISQAVISGVLANIGLSADIAENGIKALAALNGTPDNCPFQLIIMDCQMPEMDGYETTQAIRAGQAKDVHRDVPIIAMTANTMKEDREKCLASGMNDYTTKPVEAEVLHEKIAFWVGVEQGKSPTRKTIPLVNKDEPKAEFNNNEQNNSSTLNNSIVWDKEGFLKRIRNNDILSRQLIAMFINDMPALKNELLTAVENCLFDDIISLAHKITGSARNLGGVNLAELTRQVEQSAKGKNRDELLSLQRALPRVFDLLIDKLQNHLLPENNTEQNINKDQL
jgi:CheY-like chemotaxis protein